MLENTNRGETQQVEIGAARQLPLVPSMTPWGEGYLTDCCTSAQGAAIYRVAKSGSETHDN